MLAGGTAVGLLLGVEPLELGLPGVWYAMGLLMVSRLGTMMWRYQSEAGPLPPSGALQCCCWLLLCGCYLCLRLPTGPARSSIDATSPLPGCS